MDRLHAPALLDEAVSQPVQQLRMRRPFAISAKVVGGTDDSAAEMVLPDPIHHHARGERIVRACDPPCQGDPATSRRKLPVPVAFNHGGSGVTGYCAWEPRFNRFPWLPEISADQDVGFGQWWPDRRASHVCNCERDRLPSRQPPLHHFNLIRKLLPFLCFFCGEILELPAIDRHYPANILHRQLLEAL